MQTLVFSRVLTYLIYGELDRPGTSTRSTGTLAISQPTSPRLYLCTLIRLTQLGFSREKVPFKDSHSTKRRAANSSRITAREIL